MGLLCFVCVLSADANLLLVSLRYQGLTLVMITVGVYCHYTYHQSNLCYHY